MATRGFSPDIRQLPAGCYDLDDPVGVPVPDRRDVGPSLGTGSQMGHQRLALEQSFRLR